jgi:hypothetical protein
MRSGKNRAIASRIVAFADAADTAESKYDELAGAERSGVSTNEPR